MKNNTFQREKSGVGKIFTIPNFLSLFRLCLIPGIAWLYIGQGNSLLAGGLLILSGITDVADGYIARRFHMVSDLGKILDPIADKVTQAAVLVCLLTKFPLIALPLIFLLLKEFCMAVTAALVIRRTGIVPQALWHGKAATVLLYSTMILHMFWQNIPWMLSTTLIVACALLIGVSGILYLGRYLPVLCQTGKPSGSGPVPTAPKNDERSDGDACSDPRMPYKREA